MVQIEKSWPANHKIAHIVEFLVFIVVWYLMPKFIEMHRMSCTGFTVKVEFIFHYADKIIFFTILPLSMLLMLHAIESGKIIERTWLHYFSVVMLLCNFILLAYFIYIANVPVFDCGGVITTFD